jgi:hypothetical protein
MVVFPEIDAVILLETVMEMLVVSVQVPEEAITE